MKKRPIRWKRWVIVTAIGLALWLALMLARGGFTAQEAAEKLTVLCDAFFVPGILLVCVSLLGFVADGGVFDMLNFGVQKALRIILPKEKRDRYPRTFYDYKLVKEAKREGHTGTGYIAVVGLVFIACAGAVLAALMQLV